MKQGAGETGLPGPSTPGEPRGTADIDEGRLVAALLAAAGRSGSEADACGRIHPRPGRPVEQPGRGRLQLPPSHLSGVHGRPSPDGQRLSQSAGQAGRDDPERWREVLLLAGAKVARGTPYAAWSLVTTSVRRPVEMSRPTRPPTPTGGWRCWPGNCWWRPASSGTCG